MLLNDLATAARESGLAVTETPGWIGRNHGAMSAVSAVVCHHTGSSGSGAWTVVRDGRSDLRGPLAQLVLERDGSVRVISNGVSWHAGTGSWPSIGRNNGNSRAIGIECVYNGSDITDAQRAAYPRLVAALCRHYRIPVGNVIGHKEWAPRRKVDPGNLDMAGFRRAVQALVNGGSPPPPPVQGGDPLVRRAQTRLKLAYASYGGNLVVDGIPGPKTTAALREFQERAHISPARGQLDAATIAALHI